MGSNNLKSEINDKMLEAWQAFYDFKKTSLKERSELLECIAKEIEDLGDQLILTCASETHLSEVRLKNERARTIFQLRNFAEACLRGNALNVSIDAADTSRTPPKPDVRKTAVPLGPVIVFGASNFPFAYSTAGGDTASALAAACPVIVKAHPAHLETSKLVATAIHSAVEKCGLPKGVFTHIEDTSIEVGKELVMHPYTKAVGFTGSYLGGKSIWEMANKREEPIPVFAEMGSVNPVFLLPNKLKEQSVELAKMLAASITLGAGQFCTNPGIIVGLESDSLQSFATALTEEVKQIQPVRMLHKGIASNFRKSRDQMLLQSSVQLLGQSATTSLDLQDIPSVAEVSAEAFLANKLLHIEVFGSFSLLVRCKNMEQMLQVARQTEGQLTSTLMATPNDIIENTAIVEEIKLHCGRLIFNNVPTGVEVGKSMQHGGPWPSSTDSRFSSVGADAINRFVRPLSFQNWPDDLLPDELKNDNPLGIYRTVNNQLTKDKIVNE
jgi:2,5-dioxopentanoate dehydrogenase